MLLFCMSVWAGAPRRSVKNRADSLGWAESSVRRMHHGLNFHPHNIAVTQESSAVDKKSRVIFSRLFLELKQIQKSP
jgi:hypothetical protein